MEITNFKGLEVQKPSGYEDLSYLQPGLVLGKFEDFSMDIPLVYTNEKGPERLLMMSRNNRILRARLDGKDSSIIYFDNDLMIAKGFSITPLTQQTCEQSRWIIENRLIKTHLPGIKQKNIMI